MSFFIDDLGSHVPQSLNRRRESLKKDAESLACAVIPGYNDLNISTGKSQFAKESSATDLLNARKEDVGLTAGETTQNAYKNLNTILEDSRSNLHSDCAFIEAANHFTDLVSIETKTGSTLSDLPVFNPPDTNSVLNESAVIEFPITDRSVAHLPFTDSLDADSPVTDSLHGDPPVVNPLNSKSIASDSQVTAPPVTHSLDLDPLLTDALDFDSPVTNPQIADFPVTSPQIAASPVTVLLVSDSLGTDPSVTKRYCASSDENFSELSIYDQHPSVVCASEKELKILKEEEQFASVSQVGDDELEPTEQKKLAFKDEVMSEGIDCKNDEEKLSNLIQILDFNLQENIEKPFVTQLDVEDKVESEKINFKEEEGRENRLTTEEFDVGENQECFVTEVMQIEIAEDEPVESHSFLNADGEDDGGGLIGDCSETGNARTTGFKGKKNEASGDKSSLDRYVMKQRSNTVPLSNGDSELKVVEAMRSLSLDLLRSDSEIPATLDQQREHVKNEGAMLDDDESIFDNNEFVIKTTERDIVSNDTFTTKDHSVKANPNLIVEPVLNLHFASVTLQHVSNLAALRFVDWNLNGLETNEKMLYLTWSDVVFYINPNYEVPCAILMSNRALYFICDSSIQFPESSFTFDELSKILSNYSQIRFPFTDGEVSRIVVGISSQCFRITGSTPNRTATVITRSSKLTENFIQNLLMALDEPAENISQANKWVLL